MTVNVRLTQRWFSLIAITVLLTTFFSSVPPRMAQAQTPTQAQAPAQTQSEDQPVEARSTSYNAEARDLPPQRSEALPEATTDKPAAPVAPSSAAPAQSAETESSLSTQTVQGTVAISVSVVPEVRHSQYITYAFSYKNNGGTATTSLLLDAVWNNFRYAEDGGAWQYCPVPTADVTGCGFIKASAFGPAISVVGNVTDGVRYSIASLAPGQSGGFKVQLFISKNTFPTSLPGGSDVRRPAASGKIYVNGEASPSSEITASSLIVGPVLRINKTLVPNLTLYPLETGLFTLTVGNAIGSGDVVNGQLRADARPATNVIVRETIPQGSQLISAEGSPTINGDILTWVIPVLNPRESRNYKLVFKKLDGSDCGKLHNTVYDVTSNEIPLYSGFRYLIPGPQTLYPVATPLSIKSVTMTPGAVVYGSEATITIVVQSFWGQDINGASLQFKLPGNATYLAGTATPALVSEPTPGQFGSNVSWLFNMPAGTRTVASEKTFSLRVRSGYFDVTALADYGSVQVRTPNGSTIPNNCSLAIPFLLNLIPRLSVSLRSDSTNAKYQENAYYVRRAENFPYTVYLVNNSNQALVVDKVTVTLPGQTGANFLYVPNSSKINGTAKEPNTIENGLGGKLEWLSVPVAANSQTAIKYSLTVQGLDYYDYCSEVNATMASEQVRKEGTIICVKINPQVELAKEANKQKATPGEEVIFTLSLTNHEAAPYMLGLVDQLTSFDWVSQISGYGTPTYDPNNRVVRWPLVSVGPNQTISATFRVRMLGDAENCSPGNKVNEAMFYNDKTSYIVQIPSVYVNVELNCRQILFAHAAERSPVSLGDKFSYTVQVSNLDATSATSTVAITDVLPFGFTYAGNDPTSQTIFTPTSTIDSGGRVRLKWTIPPIAPGQTVTMKFFARSGKSIGPYESWLIAAADGGINRCVGPCDVRTYNNASATYSIALVQVQPLITIEPSISPTACVMPGGTVNYKLTVLNTNVHSYPRTTVVLTVPLGLSYVSSVGASPVPGLSATADGATVLWWNINVPKKPDNAFGAQVVMEVTLKVGNIWGTLNTELDATSTSGLIPRKDGVVDTTVKICPQQPSLAKIGLQKVVKVGDEMVYQISVANPNTNTAVTATVQDILPSNTSFVRMLTGNAPAQSGNTLTWNLNIPAATNSTGSVAILRFATRVNSGTLFQKYTNTATITQSSVPFTTKVNNVDINTASFTISKPTYLPLVHR